MNDFAINLKGIQGVVKPSVFYKPKATVADRTFLCEGGIGCSPTPGTRRTLTGRWVSDNARDTISAYDLEYITVDGKRIRQQDSDNEEIPVVVASEPTPESKPVLPPIPQKKVRRKA